MSISVLKPGMLSTLQDSGRHGFQHFGVSLSGAMDAQSHRLANLLAGNKSDEATLEITLRGPRLRFERDALIALCGADFAAAIDGTRVAQARPLRVRAGATLDLGTALTGCRAYLAVHGGFAVPQVMGSRSTYEHAHIGGFHGRALREGDALPIGLTQSAPYPLLASALAASKLNFATPRWAVNQHLEKLARTPQIIRIVAGRQWDAFAPAARDTLTSAEFRLAPDSDRMGCRLEGVVLNVQGIEEMLSEAVSFGTIQVPRSGQPIVLMADRQTVGGYPKIAEVISVDLRLLAQLRPGERLRFELISLAQAQALYLQRERENVTIGEAVAKHLNL